MVSEAASAMALRTTLATSDMLDAERRRRRRGEERSGQVLARKDASRKRDRYLVELYVVTVTRLHQAFIFHVTSYFKIGLFSVLVLVALTPNSAGPNSTEIRTATATPGMDPCENLNLNRKMSLVVQTLTTTTNQSHIKPARRTVDEAYQLQS